MANNEKKIAWYMVIVENPDTAPEVSFYASMRKAQDKMKLVLNEAFTVESQYAKQVEEDDEDITIKVSILIEDTYGHVSSKYFDAYTGEYNEDCTFVYIREVYVEDLPHPINPLPAPPKIRDVTFHVPISFHTRIIFDIPFKLNEEKFKTNDEYQAQALNTVTALAEQKASELNFPEPRYSHYFEQDDVLDYDYD